jgi:hypothetical protein
MLNDTIVDEIHQFRAQLLEQHGGDIAVYFAALQKKQLEHRERYVSFAQVDNTPQQALGLPLNPPGANDL